MSTERSQITHSTLVSVGAITYRCMSHINGAITDHTEQSHIIYVCITYKPSDHIVQSQITHFKYSAHTLSAVSDHMLTKQDARSCSQRIISDHMLLADDLLTQKSNGLRVSGDAANYGAIGQIKGNRWRSYISYPPQLTASAPRYQILQHFKLTNGFTGGAMEPPKAKESSTERYCTVYTPVRGRECRRRQARGVQRWLCNSYINIFGQLCRPAETDQLGTRGEGGIPTLT